MFILLLVSLYANQIPKMDFKNQKLDSLEKPWVGYVDSVIGKAYINRYNDDGTNIMFNFPVERYTLIHSKDEINVGTRGKVDILLKNNNTLSLSQNTVFKIFKHEVELTRQESLFSLLWGTVKASVNRLSMDSDYRVQTPNATIGVRGTEFLTQYSGLTKTTKVACLTGLVSVKTVMNAKEEVVREQLVKPNEYMRVETVFENGVSINQAKEPKVFSKQVLAGVDAVFETSAEDSINPWKYQELSTSFLRFGAGGRLNIYSSDLLRKDKIIGLIEYIPIIQLYEFIYLEPGINVYFPVIQSNLKTYFSFYGNLSFNFWKGFVLGAGWGFSYLEKLGPDFDNGHGFNSSLTYYFNDKLWGVLDGISLKYERTNFKKDELDSAYYLLGLTAIINFDEGRNRW